MTPLELYADHDRFWDNYDYVYPVLSRRSHGLSVGINLSPGGGCTFRCVYCQVDSARLRPFHSVTLSRLETELNACLMSALSGDIYHTDRFSGIPAPLKRVNDIAFSGDGEPTLSPVFPDAVTLAARIRSEMITRFPLAREMKLVLITNATHLTHSSIRSALDTLMANHGQIWAKLDAGTEAWYEKINRPLASAGSLDDVTHGIISVARRQPVVIQTMWCSLESLQPDHHETSAYLERLRYILELGAHIEYIQLYSVCRRTALEHCRPVDHAVLLDLAGIIKNSLNINIEVI